ncbi:hypothetical protein [Streptomyces sp. enrichment culture]|uniref:hypothetical protein n=1 Tax=Streptomyces sp. enrichment culture TaxID=1795815 RepID=UPI003F57BC35
MTLLVLSFHRELLAAREDIGRVVALCPGDPTPLVAELWTARGLGYSHAETDALWSQITDLAPYHFEAHTSALQYWTAKWPGSHQLAREFAEKSAAGAPPGSLLAVLPVIAWYESHKDELGPVGYCPLICVHWTTRRSPTRHSLTRITRGLRKYGTCWGISCTGRAGTEQPGNSSAMSTASRRLCHGGIHAWRRCTTVQSVRRRAAGHSRIAGGADGQTALSLRQARFRSSVRLGVIHQ